MSLLGPITYTTFADPYVRLGWGATPFIPAPSYTPSYVFPYSYLSPSIGGRYFYGSYFSPAYAGISFGLSYPGSYHYDVMDAGFRLLGWGNTIEADPFYRFYYNPWFFGPVLLPPPPYWPTPQPVSYQPPPPTVPQPAPAPTVQVGQPSGGQGANRRRLESEAEQPSPTPEQIEEFNRNVAYVREQEEAARRQQGAGSGAAGQANRQGTRRRPGEIDPARVRR